MLLTGNAWISPGQWGSDAVIVFYRIKSGLYCNDKGSENRRQSRFPGKFWWFVVYPADHLPRLAYGPFYPISKHRQLDYCLPFS